MSKVYNLKPFQYIHILDKNQNKKRLIEGPTNYAVQDHEIVINDKIENMMIIPNLNYMLIKNPIARDEKNDIVLDKFALPKNKWGTTEIRTRDKWSTPFPLYPGEQLISKYVMTFVPPETGKHLKSIINFVDETGVVRNPGDEWIITGPCYFYLRPEVVIVEEIVSYVIVKPNALKVAATRSFQNDVEKRVAGEEWLVFDEGRYFPNVFERVVEEVKATILDESTAVHLKAINNYIDIYGVKRNAGEEWIITREIAPFHTCGIYEQVVSIIQRTILNINQYVVVENPYNKELRKNEFGKKKLIKGVNSFFKNPGEILGPIQQIYILTHSDALLLQAIEDYTDDNEKKIVCGEKWMIKGPTRYVPPVEVNVLEQRQLIPLDKNEGIYIRNKNTGAVRIHKGSSYLLEPYEVLWEKELPSKIEAIYLNDMSLTSRNKTRIVSYKCPFNCIMQIYNLKQKSNRIVVGPNLATLEPEEEFCLISLSGKTPKVENIIQTLYLKLGPIFSTDEFQVETSDHTRLMLMLSYNWRFDIDPNNIDEANKIFSVRDFVGDLCSTMGSKIRSSIATIKFEDFHKNSDAYIKKAVFGEDHGKLNTLIKFEACNLLVTDVDIKTVLPSDPKTQVLLQKSVSLAIELTTKTIEQEFNILQKIKDQEFKGELEKLKITNNIEQLKKEIILNKLKVEANIIEKTGFSRAQALAKKEADLIESSSIVSYVKKEVEANTIENEFEVTKKKKEYDNEYLRKSKDQLISLNKQLQLNIIETDKFKKIMEALGPDTLVEIAKAGPELQAKLLSGLNLSGYILTDGNNPINLFNVANNLVKTDK